jgi:methylmalonyl-CoA/ethylmalonyl-CoA epimerase
MKKIEHIGIAVKDIEASNQLFSKLLNTLPYKSEAVESEGVITSFFQIGEVKIELLQATNEESPIHKYIEKNGEGIHHLAFAVEDTNLEIARLKSEGFQMIPEEYQRYTLIDNNPWKIEYPILEYPLKASSLKLDKAKVIEGKLIGIRGQYLLFENGGINMRSHAGYRVSLSV